MSGSRRKLEVGADGMADVLILTDPIPRALSIVSWGANDRPAESWKSAAMPEHVLRQPPSATQIDGGSVSLNVVETFIAETLDAWTATVTRVLAQPLTSAERSAQVRGLTSQAGARVAAFAAAVSPVRLNAVASSYKTVNLKLPDPPSSPTLLGEIDRRNFMAGLQSASASITDAVLSAMRDTNQAISMTESILNVFGQVANGFSQWALSMPDGIVGVPAPESTQNSSLDPTLQKIQSLIASATGGSAPEISMDFTIEQLNALALANPLGFLTAIQKAHESLKASNPEVAQKFMWGETGVTQQDPAAIMAALTTTGSEALAGLIASAIGGVNLDTVAGGDSPQVASTMRSGLSRVITHELKNNPKGELAVAVKSLVAESVGAAVAQSLEQVFSSGNSDTSVGGIDFNDAYTSTKKGADGNDVDEPEIDYMQPQIPGLHRPV